MNRTVGKFAAAVYLTLPFCVAHAQQTPPVGAPMDHPANSVSGASVARPHNRMDAAAATPFDSLDASHQGYLTRENAATDSWLALHFAQCDADRDGRVTRAEYTACSRAHP